MPTNEEIPEEIDPAKPVELAPEEDAGRAEVALYAFGNIENAMANQFYRLVNSILIMSMAMNPLLIGMVLGLKTLWDAVTDPVMAHVSDNAKTRWGRRRPFILFGGVGRMILLVVAVLLFPGRDLIIPNDVVEEQKSEVAVENVESAPIVLEEEDAADLPEDPLTEMDAQETEVAPEPVILNAKSPKWYDKIVEGWRVFNQTDNAAERAVVFWMIIVFLLFTTFSTILTVPYYALGIEISPSYDGRTRVVTYRAVMDNIAGLAGPWVLPFCYLTFFQDAIQGLFWICVVTAAIGIPSTVLMVRYTKERTHVVIEKHDPDRLSFGRSILETLKSVHVLKIVALYVFFGISLGIFAQLGMFLNVYYLFGGDKLVGTSYMAGVETLGWALAFAFLPVVNWMCKKFQKHNTARFAVITMGFACILKWWAINPEHPEYQYVLPFFWSIGISSFYTVLSTMMADVTDVDELQTGFRREGMISAVMGFLMKLIFTLQPILAGAVLVIAKFDATLGGNQTEETIYRMRIMYSFVPGVLCFLGLLLLYRYPLTRERMEEIKVELIKRRAIKAAKIAG